LDQDLVIKIAEIGPHHSHSFLVATVQLAILLVDDELLWTVNGSLGNNSLKVGAIKLAGLHYALVGCWNAQVGPIDSITFE
jgi:hypothetical protein